MPDVIEEIPFDVSDWGDRVVRPLWATEEEFQVSLDMPMTPEYVKLRERALELERERVNIGGE